ncbi:MAG: DUF4180 domain-containing protein [Pedobacter sp.]|nr:MAG: DUF4180 domain-containing protein [Pedobacter sp.]
MKIEIHEQEGKKIAEVTAQNILISNAEEALQILADLYYQECDSIILHEENISPEFFDLKTGLAGEILQKFSNYRMRLAIIGDFDKYPGQSIRDFIFESNKGRHINFLKNIEDAKTSLFKS